MDKARLFMDNIKMTKKIARPNKNHIHPMKNLCPRPDCGVVKSLRALIDDLTSKLCAKEHEIIEKDALVEELRGQINNLNSKVFGASSEKSRYLVSETTEFAEDKLDVEQPLTTEKKRGAVVGHKGNGRKIPVELKTVDVVHELSDEKICCLQCNRPYRKTTLKETSSEIDIEIVITRKIHRRCSYSKTCTCENAPTIITAPKPPQVIPKSMLSNAFWGYLLIQKYFFQIPLHRQITQLSMQGFSLLAGTVLGGFVKLFTLLEPLYEALIAFSRTEEHWHADETRWLMFIEKEGKANFRWWLWTFVSEKVVAFVLDPHRSGKVADTYFGADAKGTVNVDRYSAYHCLENRMERALCWYHVRRDFVKAIESSSELSVWAESWIAEIATLERRNDERLTLQLNSDAYQHAQESLEDQIVIMKRNYEKELAESILSKRQKTILKSLMRNWNGLSIFVHNPAIPMHNNVAERALRSAAVGRKNYYGHHAEWSGQLSVVCMTIFQTADKHGLNLHHYLKYYFDACAQLGRAPETFDEFLPWNISEEIIVRYDMRQKSKKKR